MLTNFVSRSPLCNFCVLARHLCVLAVGGKSPGWTTDHRSPQVAFIPPPRHRSGPGHGAAFLRPTRSRRSPPSSSSAWLGLTPPSYSTNSVPPAHTCQHQQPSVRESASARGRAHAVRAGAWVCGCVGGHVRAWLCARLGEESRACVVRWVVRCMVRGVPFNYHRHA